VCNDRNDAFSTPGELNFGDSLNLLEGEETMDGMRVVDRGTEVASNIEVSGMDSAAVDAGVGEIQGILMDRKGRDNNGKKNVKPEPW
jgi:hypothetical protein